MSTEAAQYNHPFNVYRMVDEQTKGNWVGGSYDNISAVTIACAVYAARQNYSPDFETMFAVFDSTDTPIAFVGLGG